MDPAGTGVIILGFVDAAILARRGWRLVRPANSVPFEMSEQTKAATRERIDRTVQLQAFLSQLEGDIPR